MSRWITVDPGEDTGLSVWEGSSLIYGETLKMGVVDLFFHALLVEEGRFIEDYPEAADLWEQTATHDIDRVVCEDWRLYPWVMYTPDGRASHALDFDQCRTARLIGAITLCCRVAGVPIHLQGAKIKDTAIAGGAENLFYAPLHENRHQNDAIMHGVHWLIVEENQAPTDARV